MPRKKDVNLSHCGNAISRMWSPFGCGVLGEIGGKGDYTISSDSRLFDSLKPQDFSAGLVTRPMKRIVLDVLSLSKKMNG